MAIPHIDPIPVAMQSMAQAVFDAMMDGYMRQLPTYTDQLNILAGYIEASRVDAAASAVEAAAQALAATLSAADAASSAMAASAAAGAAKWVSNKIYADGEVAWSPMDRYPYRRIGAGSGTVDPKLDTANWALQLFSIGLGGASITGAITLTAMSPAGILVTPTGHGLYAWLPNATTCQKLALQQIVHNAGEYDYGIKDSTGTVLGWIRPGTTAVVSLIDNSAAAGVWAISNLAKVGVTAAVTAPSINVAGGNSPKRVTIDANRTMLLIYSTGGSLYAFVYDSSTLTSSTTLLRTGAPIAFDAVLSAANQVLLVSADGTALEATTLTLSGVTVTPNSGTKATATLGNMALSISLRAVGLSWVFACTAGGSASPAYEIQVRALSISGTAPTLGAPTALPYTGTGSAPSIVVAGNIARLVFISVASNALVCIPYSLSGTTTLTQGTLAVSSAAPSTVALVAPMGNGDILTLYPSSGGASLVAAVFKLTGTAESASAVTVWIPGSPVLTMDAIQISATKSAICARGSTGAGDIIGIIANTGGVPTVGTAGLGASAGIAFLGVSGNTLRVSHAKLNANPGLLTFDCSGAAPAISAASLTGLVTAVPEVPSLTSTFSGGRRFTTLAAGANSYIFDKLGSPIGQYGPNTVRPAPPISAPINYGVPGAAPNESWAINTDTGVGVTFCRIEAAA